jgi:potassium-dependent mechanosensitive channel
VIKRTLVLFTMLPLLAISASLALAFERQPLLVAQGAEAQQPPLPIAQTQAVPAAPAPAAPAESDEPAADASRQVDRLKAQTQDLQRYFRPDVKPEDRDLNEMRQKAENTIEQATKILDTARPRYHELKDRLSRLAPPPAAGQPPEPDALAGERASLNARLSQLLKPITGAQDAVGDANNLLDRINRERRILFANKLLQRVASPLSPSFWLEVRYTAEIGLRKLSFMAGVWWANLFDESSLYIAAVLSGLVWVLTSTLAFWGIARFRAWDAPEPPPFWRRASSAAWVVLFTAFPPIAAVGLFDLLIAMSGIGDANIDKILDASVTAVAVVAAVNALATTLLAPNKPQWRIFTASGPIAARIRWLCVGMAAVFGADLVMSALNEVVAAPLSLAIAQNAVASAAFAILGMALFILPSNSVEMEDTADLRWLRFLRFPFAAIAFAILVCALIGYVALARFLAAQIVVTGTIIIILYLTYLAVDAFAESLKDESAVAGSWLKNDFGLDEIRRSQVALPVSLVLKVAAFSAAVPLIMLQIGFDWGDVQHLLRQAFFGFDIGNIRVSFASLIAALIVFVIAYMLARLFQEWLDRQILAKAGISGSARESIRTGIGYSGIFLAGIAAFSSAGVSFSNFAIVAGALSVGVGLGLQGVVNNFVSGLILLAERPIRVGDWVEVGSEEGIVRRISVRATEIETFDRANIVIPNSMLISDKVKNWTLHNDTGRAAIAVSVAVGSDPEHVRDILRKVASDHVEVLTAPAPVVYFENFTSTSLDFKLYVYLLNITRSMAVRTELRIAILKAFRAAGIQTPHSELDVFIRNFQGAALGLAKQVSQGGGISLPDLNLKAEPQDLKN